MKKILGIVCGLMMMAAPAFAQLGTLSVAGQDFAAKADCDWDGLYKGITGGTSGAIGASQFNAQGVVLNGGLGFGTPGQPGVPAYGMAAAGADTDSYAYRYASFGGGVLEVGAVVGTGSTAFSGVANDLGGRVTLNPIGAGGFRGDISGLTAEGTTAGSFIALPWMYDSHGFTYGVAEQGAVGGYAGNISGSALFFGEARAGVGASILINGVSAVESGRYAAWDFCNDTYTEGLYSKGIVGTSVTSDGYYGTNQPDRNPFTTASANLNGGWAAQGSLDLGATQVLCDPAFASASMHGSYAGAGPLGTNYLGEAKGFAGTSITQVPNGVISQSYAGGSVISVINPNNN